VRARERVCHYTCLAFLLVAGTILFFSRLEGTLSLWDEAYYAAVSKGSYNHHLILFPAANPGERACKSALFFWLADLSFMIFGVSGYGLRFPSAVGAFAGVIFLYLIGRKFYGTRVGFLAALFLLTSREYHLYPRNTMHDPLMLAFQLGFVWCAIQREKTRPWHMALGGAFLGLALFLKQFLGLSVLGPVLLYWWWGKAWPKASRKSWLLGFASFYLFGCGWYTIAAFYDFSHVRTLLFTYNLTERFTQELDTDPWFWVKFFTDFPRQGPHPILYAGFFASVWSVVEFFRKREGGLVLFGSWLWALVFVLHLATFRAVHYALPMYPCLCLFIALMADRLWTGDWNGIDLIALGWSTAYLLLNVAPGWLSVIPFGTPLGKALILGVCLALLFRPKWPLPRYVRSAAAGLVVGTSVWIAAEMPPRADYGRDTFGAIESVWEEKGRDATIHADFFAYYHVLWYHDGPAILVNEMPDSTLPIPEGDGYLFAMSGEFETWPADRYDLLKDTGFFKMVRFHPPRRAVETQSG